MTRTGPRRSCEASGELPTSPRGRSAVGCRRRRADVRLRGLLPGALVLAGLQALALRVVQAGGVSGVVPDVAGLAPVQRRRALLPGAGADREGLALLQLRALG